MTDAIKEIKGTSALDVTQFEPSKETLPVPPELFPIIRKFPLGSLVLIQAVGHSLPPEHFDSYLADIKEAFPGSDVMELPHEGKYLPLVGSNERSIARGARYRAVEDQKVTFIFQRDKLNITLEQEADYSFYVHKSAGWGRHLIIELGKCRVAYPVMRTEATVYEVPGPPSANFGPTS